MKKIIFSLVFVILTSLLFSADLTETGNGEFLFLTNVSEPDLDYPYWKGVKFNGDRDCVIIRYGADRREISKISVGGKSDDSFVSLCQFGNYYYVVGTAFRESLGTGDFKALNSKGMRDCILAKFDRNLKLVKCINFGTEGYNFPTDIAADREGNIFVTGRIFSNTSDSQCAFIAKFGTDLKTKAFAKFRGSFAKQGDAYSTEFSSCIVNDDKILVCGTVSDDMNALGIVAEYTKDLKMVFKKSIKEPYFAVLQSIKENRSGFSVSGYAMKDDCPIGYYALLDSSYDVVFSKTYVSYTIENPKYPAYCYMPKVLKNFYVWGNGGLYKGNGDYDGEMEHQFICDFSSSSPKNKIILPENTVSSCITGKNEIISAVFNRDLDSYSLIKTKFMN